ncbi:MAG: DUF3500 domain-containing protein [Gemmataceae bacterium]|nr:DUF3500 domain-containing protein [Gemmataceae bacterium]
MSEDLKSFCPECAPEVEQPEVIDRRNFIRVLGERTAALVAVGTVAATVAPRVRADVKEAGGKPGEALALELFSGLSDEQKKQVLLPLDHGAGEGKVPTRLKFYNGALMGKKLGGIYTKPQQELIERVLKAIASDDEGFKQMTRNGTYDASGSLQNCGVHFFGEPGEGKKWSWLFTGHHLTVHCNGSAEEGSAFGGPMYYGHTPNGYSEKNCFYPQTKSVLSIYDALDGEQRKKAVVVGSPGEHEASVKFRAKDQAKPGIGFADLSKDQFKLVETVMRDILKPYRKADVDEVMEIVKKNGGLEKIHLAFYKDKGGEAQGSNWDFWRLEGPGFVWNYRVLPHVHTYVNISSKI